MVDNPDLPCLSYAGGGLVMDGFAEGETVSELFVYDQRTKQYRASAEDYCSIVLRLLREGFAFRNDVQNYTPCDLSLLKTLKPRPHQQQALDVWLKSDGRGVVSLPTGAGKTFLAIMAISHIKRPALVVVPTIDLLLQWQKTLQEFFGKPIGGIGGGQKEVHRITVATYDSAQRMIGFIGNKFGLLVCDECHHLPAEQYRRISQQAIAPYRLGLSATLERHDGGESWLFQSIGPLIYEGHIPEMAAEVLAPYKVVSIEVDLDPKERFAYERERGIYLDFVRSRGISFSEPDGWGHFLRESNRDEPGRRAFRAYWLQKRLSQNAAAKIQSLWEIMNVHKGETMIVFTDENTIAYKIGSRFLLPVLTHKTKSAEREMMLKSLREGDLKVLVTSKVLNEGVDVPEAQVGVVLSGSGTVREHVQRLGRILRHKPGKQAVLYELVSRDTAEQGVNERRRQHRAYQKNASLQD